MVFVGSLVVAFVVAFVVAAYVVAGLRLLGGFLGFSLWFSFILGACAKSIWIFLLED